MNKIAFLMLILIAIAIIVPLELQWRVLSIEKDEAYHDCSDRAAKIPPQIKTNLNRVMDITSTLRHNAVVMCMSDNMFSYNIFSECDSFSADEQCFTPHPSKAFDFSRVMKNIFKR